MLLVPDRLLTCRGCGTKALDVKVTFEEFYAVEPLCALCRTARVLARQALSDAAQTNEILRQANAEHRASCRFCSGYHKARAWFLGGIRAACQRQKESA